MAGREGQAAPSMSSLASECRERADFLGCPGHAPSSWAEPNWNLPVATLCLKTGILLFRYNVVTGSGRCYQILCCF